MVTYVVYRHNGDFTNFLKLVPECPARPGPRVPGWVREGGGVQSLFGEYMNGYGYSLNSCTQTIRIYSFVWWEIKEQISKNLIKKLSGKQSQYSPSLLWHQYSQSYIDKKLHHHHDWPHPPPPAWLPTRWSSSTSPLAPHWMRWNILAKPHSEWWLNIWQQ